MKISSPVFKNKGKIPFKYTCDGDNLSPPLDIEKIPGETKSLVLIVDDPDAPNKTWVHWVVFNIPPSQTSLAEDYLPHGAELGLNDFGQSEYGGPCPPSGTHRYFFKVYALDTTLELLPKAKKVDVEQAMGGHILDQAELIGKYKRH